MKNTNVKSETLKQAHEFTYNFTNSLWEFYSLTHKGFDDHDDPSFELILKRKKDGHYFRFVYSYTNAWSWLDEWETFIGEEVTPNFFTPGFYVSINEYKANINTNPTAISIYVYDGEQWFFDILTSHNLPKDLVPLGIVGDKLNA